MKRFSGKCPLGAVGTVILLGALGTAGLAHAGVRRTALTADATPRVQLSGLVCHTAAQQSQRSISVRASMRPVVGTEKLEIRFELLSRPGPGIPFAQVSGAGLGTWTSPPNPTLGQRPGDVWLVSHSVSNLPAPAIYRYRVSFRWIGAGGRALATHSRVSANCDQPALGGDSPTSPVGSTRRRG